MKTPKILTTALFCLVLAAVCWTPALAVQPDAPAAPTQNGDDSGLSDLLIQEPENQCLQITVWAQNEETGECREFGSTCSVPDGWTTDFDPATCTNF